MLRAALPLQAGPPHHFIEEKTGRIHDIPWDAVEVSRVGSLKGFEVHEYQVVMRGRAAGARPRR
jgi:Fe2+ or Zn2+ uptake regulation protein